MLLSFHKFIDSTECLHHHVPHCIAANGQWKTEVLKLIAIKEQDTVNGNKSYPYRSLETIYEKLYDQSIVDEYKLARNKLFNDVCKHTKCGFDTLFKYGSQQDNNLGEIQFVYHQKEWIIVVQQMFYAMLAYVIHWMVFVVAY